jgi:hypothetical protein
MQHDVYIGNKNTSSVTLYSEQAADLDLEKLKELIHGQLF